MPTTENKNDELLSLLNSRLALGKAFGKDYRNEVKDSIRDYELKSLSAIDYPDLANRLQIPYIFSTTESSVPAIFETFPEINIYAGGKKDEEFSEFANSVWSYINRKYRVKETLNNVGIMFSLTGMGCVSWGWITEVESVDEENEKPVVNELGEQVYDEFQNPVKQKFVIQRDVITKSEPIFQFRDLTKAYFSPESLFCIFDYDNTKIPYVVFEEDLDPDVVEYVYGKRIEPKDTLDISNLKSDANIELRDSQDWASVLENDIKKVKVFHYYGWLPKDVAERFGIGWTPYQVYCVIFTKSEVLKSPEPIRNKQFALLGNYGVPIKFWRFGDAYALRDLEKDLSLGRSTLMDYRDKLATKIAVPSNAEFDEDSFKSPKRFSVVRFIGDKFPQYITPPPAPEVIPVLMNESRMDIQMTSGQLDISRGGVTATVDTATGQKIFENVHGRRINLKREKIGELLSVLASNILSMCGENWDEDKLSLITDYDPQEIAQKGFLEKLKLIGESYDVVIDIENVIDNRETKAAQAIAMYRELKDSQYVNQVELIKSVIRIGFRQKDVDKYLSGQMSPEQLIQALDTLGEMGILPPEVIVQSIQMLQQSLSEQGGQKQLGDVGRPEVKIPTEIVEKSMPGADANQINAQTEASYKQVGVPKVQTK